MSGGVGTLILFSLFPAELGDRGDGLGAVHSHAAAGESTQPSVHKFKTCIRDRKLVGEAHCIKYLLSKPKFCSEAI